MPTRFTRFRNSGPAGSVVLSRFSSLQSKSWNRPFTSLHAWPVGCNRRVNLPVGLGIYMMNVSRVRSLNPARHPGTGKPKGEGLGWNPKKRRDGRTEKPVDLSKVCRLSSAVEHGFRKAGVQGSNP